MSAGESNLATAARLRESEAWDQRFKHSKAQNAWAQVADEKPDTREVSEILATWMGEYADADAKAERAFRDLAAKHVRETGT